MNYFPELHDGDFQSSHFNTSARGFSCTYRFVIALKCISLSFREKKQKIQDIKNNIKEAIEVSRGVYVTSFLC